MKKLTAYSLKILSYLFLIIAFIIFRFSLTMQKTKSDDPDYAALYVISVTMFAISLFLWRRAKRIIAQQRAKLDLKKDKIVLYLRSFAQDARLKKTYANYILYPGLPFQLNTQEENLARVVKKHGTLTAIGIPKESLPLLGASRLYFKDSEWKDFVLEAIQCSTLIIMRAGETTGFLWELEQVMSLQNKSKVLILMPGRKESYDVLASHINRICGIQLPPFSGRFFSNNDINCIIYFNRNNRVRFYFPALFYFQFRQADPFSGALKKCLKLREEENRLPVASKD